MNGVLNVYKPKGPTSHDVVARVRRLAGTKRVGHAGTLDPMAEGVLVCCLGEATKLVPWLTGLTKEYTGEITLGARSNTYDAQGELTPGGDPSGVTEEDLKRVFQTLSGPQQQAAPPFSAVKVEGRKLYEYARAGEEAPVKIRPVMVYRFELARFFPPKALFFARVGSGTYIRSLAHETGERLACGAHLSVLCRTRVGPFDAENAVPLEHLEADPEGMLPGALMRISEALTHLPKLSVSRRAEERLRNGGAFSEEDILECETPPADRSPALALSTAGDALAIVQRETAGEPFRPIRVFN